LVIGRTSESSRSWLSTLSAFLLSARKTRIFQFWVPNTTARSTARKRPRPRARISLTPLVAVGSSAGIDTYVMAIRGFEAACSG
jgi:hypothetical protein